MNDDFIKSNIIIFQSISPPTSIIELCHEEIPAEIMNPGRSRRTGIPSLIFANIKRLFNYISVATHSTLLLISRRYPSSAVRLKQLQSINDCCLYVMGVNTRES
jgi:hypothetical protein